MNLISTQIKTVTRAAVIALALGATALSAAPAMAQDAPSGFSLDVPGAAAAPGAGAERSGTFAPGEYYPDGGWDDDYYYRCLTNREVRRGIAAYGWSRVEITRDLGRDRVEVRAVYRNWLYSMRVDKCSGEVNRIRPIRRVNGGWDGGFGLEFNFGN
ncbi:hypothetical protein [Devosia lacusdianchii]|jgi:hypothetical protein|uniref:hypothetical protein n=1 Tax=Devosia lacusdianchii TaxID=2917991 RepID=UPI001F05FF09|nr:hypothetical protein [Devosia sp. JXJ CY 41]